MPEHTPTRDDLLAYLLGEGDAALRDVVERAVERHPGVAGELSGLREALGRLRAASGLAERFAVEPERVRRLEGLIGTRPESLGEWVGRRVRDVVATIVFDSARAPAVAGFRGVSAARIVKAASEDVEIEMRVTYDDAADLALLTGRCRGSGGATGLPMITRVTAVPRGGGGEVETSVGVEGEYFEASVPAGVYELRFEGDGGSAAVIDGIELGPSAGGRA